MKIAPVGPEIIDLQGIIKNIKERIIVSKTYSLSTSMPGAWAG